MKFLNKISCLRTSSVLKNLNMLELEYNKNNDNKKQMDLWKQSVFDLKY